MHGNFYNPRISPELALDACDYFTDSEFNFDICNNGK